MNFDLPESVKPLLEKMERFVAEIVIPAEPQIMERGFYDLDAPVARVCSAEVPMPYAGHLEEAALPQADKIAEAVREMLTRSR